MLPVPIVEVVAGTTLKATWISSGTNVASLDSQLLDSNDAVVNTFAAVASGNGHYFAVHNVPTSGYPYLVNRWQAFIESNTYVYRQLVRVHRLEV